MKPVNKNILLKKIEKPAEEVLVLLPELETKFRSYIVLDTAIDVTIKVYPGDKVVVLGSMVEEVVFDGASYLFAPQSAVMGVVSE